MDNTASSSITTEKFHGIEKKRSSPSTISSVTSAARSIASVFNTSIPGDITEHELQDYPHTGRSSLQTDAATLHVMGAGGNTGATTPVYRDSSDSDSTLTASSVPSREGSPPLEEQQEREEVVVVEQEWWLKAFWGDNISVVVSFKHARDHLALERTYLSYHRTAMVFGMLSVVTAQLTIINHAPNPSPTFGFRTVGKPLSVVLACCALIISIVGVLRWWRLQNGLLRGVSISGGRELVVVGAIVGAVIAGTLGLVVAVDITKEY
ncbi:uncharacterized protein LAJ45_04592 [Morchella importuna]|uniref:uncharacterized protein n=1 Tax=Morchella importuna TaxID=1174673 RepID=UPI001E8D7E0D|nr:uncharacterized protein LAJ45_04592 [Morchella importuna]KAH8151390.1 hypothetical protein LAJ45_04592 [Morchella importuna]